MSARPSPFTSPRTRGVWSWLDPAAGRRARAESIRRQDGGSEAAIGLAERGIGPAKPKPTMSARPSPFTSPRSRGAWSWLAQPPAAAPEPKYVDARTGAAKCHRPGRARYRRPRNRSRRCRPGRRRSHRRELAGFGSGSPSRRPPRSSRRQSTPAMGAAKVPSAWPSAVNVPAKPKPTISARPSPFTSPRTRGFWSRLTQPPAAALEPKSFDATIGCREGAIGLAERGIGPRRNRSRRCRPGRRRSRRREVAGSGPGSPSRRPPRSRRTYSAPGSEFEQGRELPPAGSRPPLNRLAVTPTRVSWSPSPKLRTVSAPTCVARAWTWENDGSR